MEQSRAADRQGPSPLFDYSANRRFSSATICSRRRRSVERFSKRMRASSGVGFICDSACCWSFRSTISSISLTTISACIDTSAEKIAEAVLAANRQRTVTVKRHFSAATNSDLVANPDSSRLDDLGQHTLTMVQHPFTQSTADGVHLFARIARRIEQQDRLANLNLASDERDEADADGFDVRPHRAGWNGSQTERRGVFGDLFALH